tara:strand:- start:1884 stop:2135 length:252 start_codon:yes stop_codon:yes gene_type:complete
MTKVKCVHFWEIEDGRLGRAISVGVCQHCKEEKEFKNWVDIVDVAKDKKGKEKSTALWRQNFALSGSNPKHEQAKTQNDIRTL